MEDRAQAYNDPAQMYEEGLVRTVAGQVASVETVQKEACAHCSAKGACQAMGGESTRLVVALNQAGAQVGDRVVLAAARRAVLGTGFLVYMLPVFALLAGAAVGKANAASWGLDPTAAAAALGVGALAVCWLGLIWLNRRVARRGKHNIKVVRILKRGEADAVEQCAAGL